MKTEFPNTPTGRRAYGGKDMAFIRRRSLWVGNDLQADHVFCPTNLCQVRIGTGLVAETSRPLVGEEGESWRGERDSHVIGFGGNGFLWKSV